MTAALLDRDVGTTVTVVVPTLDEQETLPQLLRSIDAQTYPWIVEVLVVDGGSSDATVPIARAHPGVRVLENLDRIQSSALNRGLAVARGEVVVRVDAHAVIAPDYVERCVQALDSTGAALVGGAQRPVARGFVQRGVAAAMRSRLGVGAAAYHQEDRSDWVDTVWLGAFRADDGRAIGGYDERLPVNEDADFAFRMRRRGGVWLDSSIVAHYVPRRRLRDVARQWGRYGYWRGRTVRRRPDSLRARQLAVPAVILGSLSPARRYVLGAYGAAVLGGAAAASRRDPVGGLAYLLVVPVTHLCWGLSFLAGVTGASTGRTSLALRRRWTT